MVVKYVFNFMFFPRPFVCSFSRRSRVPGFRFFFGLSSKIFFVQHRLRASCIVQRAHIVHERGESI